MFGVRVVLAPVSARVIQSWRRVAPALPVLVLAGCVSVPVVASSPTSVVTSSSAPSATATDISGDACQEKSLGLSGCEVAVPPAPEGAQRPTSQVTATDYPYTVEQYLTYIVGDLDKTWSAWFTQNGYSEPMVTIEIVEPGQTYVSECTSPDGRNLVVGSDYENAFYCPLDTKVVDGVTYEGAVILPVTTFQKMWSGDIFTKQSQQTGDFAAAIITAHEFGHHVQDEILDQYNAQRPDGGTRLAQPTGKNKELIADCLAGNWMTSAYYSGLLTDTDVEEAVAALESIGDQGVNADPHGTSAERAAALKLGYDGGSGYPPGSPGLCIAT